jgi:hypothetical protein
MDEDYALWVTETFKGKNTSREDLQADEVVGWGTASASPEAGHRRQIEKPFHLRLVLPRAAISPLCVSMTL